MSITLKRTVAACLVLSVLFGMVTVFAAGSQTDPLITKSYLEGAYSSSLRNDINATLANAAAASTNRVNSLLSQYTSLEFAQRFTPISLGQRGSVILYQGTSFTLRSGTASLQVSSGTVINVTTGTIVSSGSQLQRNQRYFCAENSSATVTASTALSGYIDGYYSRGSGFLPPSASLPFTDVPANAIYFEALAFAHANGIITGSGGRFFPNDSLSRSAFALMLHRYAGSPQPAGTGGAFSDVGRSNVAFTAITWAHERSIITGAGGRFYPDDSVTREALALMLYRYHVASGGSTASNSDALNTFADRGSISPVATEALRWAVSHGLITGSGGRVYPGDTATRSASVLVLFRYFSKFGDTFGSGGSAIPSTPPSTSTTPPSSQTVFSDVPANSIAFEAINWAQSNGIVTGSGGRFYPNDSLSRSAFALILHRYAGSPQPTGTEGTFSDVYRSNVAFTAITWAHENVIVTGSGGKFYPDDPVTREAMVLMLYRYHLLKGRTVTSNNDALNVFSDTGSISPIATDAMRWAVSNGLITGSGNRVSPKDTATRSASVLVLFRYNNLFNS